MNKLMKYYIFIFLEKTNIIVVTKHDFDNKHAEMAVSVKYLRK